MTKTLKIAAAALAASMFAGTAHASINPIEIDIAPEIAAPIAGTTLAQATYGATTVEEFEERLKDRSDDGTLNERDYYLLRQFQQATATVDELIDDLKDRSDDGTLNERDYFEIRKFERQQVAQWHPEAEALKERLERQSDDGTLNSQDFRRVQQLHRSLTS